MRTLAAVFATVLCAAQTPQFEVASVKPAPPPDPNKGMRVSMRGGPGSDDPLLYRCENCSLSNLVTIAFNIRDYQLSAPTWINDARFDLSARIPPGATSEQFQQMLQNLLADRFKMTFHHGTKEMPVLNLLVAKNGPKFRESVLTEKVDSADEPAPVGPQKDANGFPILPKRKGMSMSMTPDRATVRASETQMASLTAMLSGQLKQPVLDATGLTGRYDIALQWIPGDAPDNPGPTLFQALQEQLGLKLESKKSPIDILVIDHLEKIPTEN